MAYQWTKTDAAAPERVLLIGLDCGDYDAEASMAELERLTDTAGGLVVGHTVQKRPAPEGATYIGSGLVESLAEFCRQNEVDLTVADGSLTPVQARNLERALGTAVIDRTALILDIFAARARSSEGKLQVELAQLQYRLPRLGGQGNSLSRLGGGIGTRGPGESKLESDRRHIRRRITALQRELKTVQERRERMHLRRQKNRALTVALVGYTNAGKSTILNRMVEQFGELPEKTVMEKDMLFATLETSVRSIDTGHNKPFFLTDTVGFIHKLPHGLVKAFRSTLEEVKYADLLVQVVDFSDENYRQQMQVTADTLKELGAGDIPQIVVYNKADKCGMEPLPQKRQEHWYLAAGQNTGIRELAEAIEQQVYADNVDCTFLIPYSVGNVASYLMEEAQVFSTEYREDGILIHADCHRQDMERYKTYMTQ